MLKIFLDIVHDGLTSNEGCSDPDQESGSDSSSNVVLSEFSCTPTNSPTNSLNDEGGDADGGAGSFIRQHPDGSGISQPPTEGLSGRGAGTGGASIYSNAFPTYP